MQLEGSWPVYNGEGTLGFCEISPAGLYWNIHCTLGAGWEGVSRLVLFAGEKAVSLGIPIPQGTGLILDRKLSQKALPCAGDFFLELLPVDAPLLSRRGKPEKLPEDEPQTAGEESADGTCAPERIPEEVLPEIIPEDIPEEAQPEIIPEDILEEVPPEIIPEDIPEEVLPEIIPKTDPGEASPEIVSEQPPEETEETTAIPEAKEVPRGYSPESSPWGFHLRPGEPLPSLKHWQQLRASPDGEGGFFLRREENN